MKLDMIKHLKKSSTVTLIIFLMCLLTLTLIKGDSLDSIVPLMLNVLDSTFKENVQYFIISIFVGALYLRIEDIMTQSSEYNLKTQKKIVGTVYCLMPILLLVNFFIVTG